MNPELGAEELEKLTSTIVKSINTQGLTKEDYEDLRGEVLVGILEGSERFDDGEHTNFTLYVCSWGFGAGMNYLKRTLYPWNAATVHISDANKLGILIEDSLHYNEEVLDTEAIVSVLKEIDDRGWVGLKYGISGVEKSVVDIAASEGVHRNTVNDYVEMVLNELRTLYRAD